MSTTDEANLRGHWHNGDPVHIITDGTNRWVAPNLNGAMWIPDPDPLARWREHMICEQFGGTCSCGDTYPAPGPSEFERLALIECAAGRHRFPILRSNGTACFICGAEPEPAPARTQEEQ